MSFWRRWILRNEKSIQQLAYGKTMTERFHGLRRGLTNEARLLLVAMVPILVWLPFSTKSSDASQAEKILVLILGIWFVVVVSFGLCNMVRSAARVIRKNNG
jgi:hypothetical protein